METLFAAFLGKNNSSKMVLDEINCKNKLYLVNNKLKSCQQISSILTDKIYDKIIIIGQKPLIKNKVCLEICAHSNDHVLKTNFDLEEIINQINKFQLDYKISTSPGCSYCNNIYYFTLDFLKKSNIKTQVILIHIPFIKNFQDKIKIFIDLLNSIA